MRHTQFLRWILMLGLMLIVSTVGVARGVLKAHGHLKADAKVSSMR